MKFYLSNDEIDRLRDEFKEEEFMFYDIFYQPFVNGQINSRLLETALSPDAARGERMIAFWQMIEPDKLSRDQADQIFDVWMSLDSTNLQAMTRRSVLKMGQCGLVSTNLV